MNTSACDEDLASQGMIGSQRNKISILSKVRPADRKQMASGRAKGRVGSNWQYDVKAQRRDYTPTSHC